MNVDELIMQGDSTPLSALEVAWSEVEHAGRSVDRQIECLRSILAAVDADLAAAGPLGDLVRDTPDYVAARGVPAPAAEALPLWVQVPTEAVLAGLHAISDLVSRGIDRQAVAAFGAAARSDVRDDGRTVDVVNGLIDEVTERYRSVLIDLTASDLWTEQQARPASPPPRRSRTASLALHAEHLADALARRPVGPEGDGVAGSVVVRSTTTWLLIAVHVAEIDGWVQAVRALRPPTERWA